MSILSLVTDEKAFLASGHFLPVYFDTVFRRIFDDSEDCFLLKSMLNALLHLEGPRTITQLSLRKRDLPGLRAEDKESIVDISAIDGAGHRFNIEMQVNAQAFYHARAVFYLSLLHSSQLENGEGYRELLPTFGLHFLCFDLFDRQQYPGVHSVFELKERLDGRRFSDQLQLHTLELEKLVWDEDNPPELMALDRGLAWLYFIRYGHLFSEGQRKALLPPELAHARARLAMISNDEDARWAYISWERKRRDNAYRLSNAAAWGRMEGKKEGLDEGLRKGLAILEALVKDGLLSPEAFETRRAELLGTTLEPTPGG